MEVWRDSQPDSVQSHIRARGENTTSRDDQDIRPHIVLKIDENTCIGKQSARMTADIDALIASNFGWLEVYVTHSLDLTA
jgi:hypothetical protein